VRAQWGCELDKSLVWLMSSKDRLYLADKDMEKVDFRNLRVDKIGLYVATVNDKGVRLSIEGSQILGPYAEKNVVDINDDDLAAWLRGEDLARKPEGCEGFIILRNMDDFVGCGKVTEKGILNFVPKTRRIASS
ncbi:hypothetical protein KY359_02345, partial [Candidatus Woesearchaeota archaeon]|nr:hypothetical protein [Candidatus Woesearchaeota archaeon]